MTTYQPPKIPVKIPINTQFCIDSSRPSIELVTSREIKAETARTIANSITNHIQCGKDSVGM